MKKLLQRTIRKTIYPISTRILLYRFWEKLLRKNGYNICYNKFIRRDYDKKKKNILLAIESPEVIKYNKWLDEEMVFVAEISFANFFNLNNYYCCRSLYATNDNFVNFNVEADFNNKDKLVSFIFSDRNHLSGHQFRHRIANELTGKADLFGSGTGIHLKRKSDSLENYMFQIVVENGKYPEYVSEKFFDCLKTKTLPIYYGGEVGLQKMGFDQRGWLTFNTIDELKDVLITKIHKNYYQDCLPYLEFNRQRLIEIRKEQFFLNMLSMISYLGYMHKEESYHGNNVNRISFFFK